MKNLRILEKDEVFKLEPHVNPNTVAALHSPDAGNLIPYEFAIAMAENAADNGVEVRIRRMVKAIDAVDGGFTITADHWEPKPYAAKMHPSEATIPEPEVKSGSPVPAVLIALAGAATAYYMSGSDQFSAAQAAIPLEVSLGIAVLILLASSSKPNRVQGAGKAKDARKPVGTGGKRVTVEEVRKRYEEGC